MKVIVAPRAKADLRGIRATIAQDRPQVGREQIAKIRATFSIFKQHPLVGEAVHHLKTGMRQFSCGVYVIYFCPEIHQVVILRVLHGARDIDAQLFE
jgi:toxin ParE1/3/4